MVEENTLFILLALEYVGDKYIGWKKLSGQCLEGKNKESKKLRSII